MLSDPDKLEEVLSYLATRPDLAAGLRKYAGEVEARPDMALRRWAEVSARAIGTIQADISANRAIAESASSLMGEVRECMRTVPTLVHSAVAEHERSEEAALAPVLALHAKLLEQQIEREKLENERLRAEMERKGKLWNRMLDMVDSPWGRNLLLAVIVAALTAIAPRFATLLTLLQAQPLPGSAP